MKMHIDIRVKVPDALAEQRLEFVEGVMAVFRATFPEAEPIYEPDSPSPVTVTLFNDDGTPVDLSYHEDSTDDHPE